MVKYVCKICGKSFKQKAQWVYHTENKKYPCESNHIGSIEVPKISENIQTVPNHIQNQSFQINSTIKNQEITDKLDLDDKIDVSNLIDEENTNIELEQNISCGYCLSTFSRKGNLNKHLKYNCKVKKQQDKEKEEIFKQLLIKDNLLKEKEELINKKDEQLNLKNEQITQLFNKIGILEKKIDKIAKGKTNSSTNQSKLSKIINNTSNTSNTSNTNTSNTNSNNNITNNTTNNTTNTTNNTNTNNVVFQLVNYGKEDLDKIDVKDFFNAVVKNNKICGVKIPEEILKLIHFNSNYPELNNIYISDINREKCMIYDDGMWKLSPDDKIPEVIDKVVKFSYKKQDMLREKFANNKPIIDRLNVINKYTQFNDSEYVEGLKEENDYDEYADKIEQTDNLNQIKRCEDFQKKTYNAFKTTMYNEGLKIKKNKANKN